MRAEFFVEKTIPFVGFTNQKQLKKPDSNLWYKGISKVRLVDWLSNFFFFESRPSQHSQVRVDTDAGAVGCVATSVGGFVEFFG